MYLFLYSLMHQEDLKDHRYKKIIPKTPDTEL